MNADAPPSRSDAPPVDLRPLKIGLLASNLEDQIATDPTGFILDKARRELGYTSRPYREGVVDAIAWFTQAGYVRRR